jgi:hypothetical protein
LYSWLHKAISRINCDPKHAKNESKSKGKGHPHNRPQGPKGVPGRLRHRIFLTFGATRMVGLQPQAPANFNPRGIPWYSFLEAESTPGHMSPSVATEKIPSVTPPENDPVTVRLVAQCLKHYATPGPQKGEHAGLWFPSSRV